jgi:hypothetical protein
LLRLAFVAKQQIAATLILRRGVNLANFYPSPSKRYRHWL